MIFLAPPFPCCGCLSNIFFGLHVSDVALPFALSNRFVFFPNWAIPHAFPFPAWAVPRPVRASFSYFLSFTTLVHPVDFQAVVPWSLPKFAEQELRHLAWPTHDQKGQPLVERCGARAKAAGGLLWWVHLVVLLLHYIMCFSNIAEVWWGIRIRLICTWLAVVKRRVNLIIRGAMGWDCRRFYRVRFGLF